MTTTFNVCLRVLHAEGVLTYHKAASIVGCDDATAGKAFRHYELKGDVTIDRRAYPYIVRPKSSQASEGV